MSEYDLDDLMQIGRHAISAVATIDCSALKPMVCFHFSCPDDEKHDRWGNDAVCVQLSKPLFEALPFGIAVDEVGGCVGIEAWEEVIPTESWLRDRLPKMIEIAKAAHMTFDGWSFEPKGGPIISAGVNVMSANSPDGREMMDGFIESLKATKH